MRSDEFMRPQQLDGLAHPGSNGVAKRYFVFFGPIRA
jgi:hypothetical protein